MVESVADPIREGAGFCDGRRDCRFEKVHERSAAREEGYKCDDAAVSVKWFSMASQPAASGETFPAFAPPSSLSELSLQKYTIKIRLDNSSRMTALPLHRRKPSLNIARDAVYRPHEGKFGIITGGSRGSLSHHIFDHRFLTM